MGFPDLSTGQSVGGKGKGKPKGASTGAVCASDVLRFVPRDNQRNPILGSDFESVRVGESLLIGDSGCFNVKKSSNTSVAAKLRTWNVWKGLVDHLECGATLSTMLPKLSDYVNKQVNIFGLPARRSESPSDDHRLPSSYSVHVFWNLNDVYAGNKCVGVTDTLRAQILEFAFLLKTFKFPIVVLGTDATRFGLGQDYNTARDEIRGILREAGVNVKTGVDFWNELSPIATKMSGMHHYEDKNNTNALDYFFDREIARQRYLETYCCFDVNLVT